MILSPIQLLESKFLKVSLELNNVESIGDSIPDNGEIDIEHMMHIDRHPNNPPESEPNAKRKYMLALGIRSGHDEESESPYSFEIVVSGLISADPKQLKPGMNVDDSAAKYGFTMLYGQIREVLMNMTSRMPSGQFLLPTMSFMDAEYPKEEKGTD